MRHLTTPKQLNDLWELPGVFLYWLNKRNRKPVYPALMALQRKIPSCSICCSSLAPDRYFNFKEAWFFWKLKWNQITWSVQLNQYISKDILLRKSWDTEGGCGLIEISQKVWIRPGCFPVVISMNKLHSIFQSLVPHCEMNESFFSFTREH